jgi:hypothetical protein
MTSRRFSWVTLGLAPLLLLAGGWWQYLRETPEQSLLRRWLRAQAQGSIPAAVYAEVAAAEPQFRVLAAQALGRHESPLTSAWRQLRPRLPDSLRARVPLAFSTGRRGVALLTLIDGFEAEPGVARALVAVATNRQAANRRLALLALGKLPVMPAELAEPLTALVDDPEYLLRLDAAATLHQTFPRSVAVDRALRRLARDPIASVRQAATPLVPDDDQPETATP